MSPPLTFIVFMIGTGLLIAAPFIGSYFDNKRYEEYRWLMGEIDKKQHTITTRWSSVSRRILNETRREYAKVFGKESDWSDKEPWLERARRWADKIEERLEEF